MTPQQLQTLSVMTKRALKAGLFEVAEMPVIHEAVTAADNLLQNPPASPQQPEADTETKPAPAPRLKKAE